MNDMPGDITLTLLGGGREIGANCYLLQWGEKLILLDCGMDPRRSGYQALPELDLLMGHELDAVVISHAHLDHIGSLPFITTHYLGLGAKIFTTPQTAALLRPMLMESVKAVDRRIPEDKQYYYHEYASTEVLETLLTLLSLHKVDQKFSLGDTGLTGMFFHSGHILGAAGIVISDGDYTLVYTGDLCLEDQDILKGCVLPGKIDVDCLIIESTLGSEEGKKAKRSEEYARLSAEIVQVLARQGHVLIPAFGLGRAQEIMIMLARMRQDGVIGPDVPVLAHKGVTESVTAVYDRYASGAAGDVVLMDNVRFISGFKRDNSFKTAQEMAGQPGIFIFSSGMMIRGTPSARLAAELVTSQNNGIFFPGYAAPGQLGYELLNTQTGGSICIDRHDNTWVDVRCANIKKFTFSAHASAEDLIEVACKLSPACVVWVHGEETSVTRLQNMAGETLSALSPVNRETLLLRMAGKKINRSFRTYRGILVTVGTSLIYTCLSKSNRPFSAAGQVTREELQEFILENLNDLPGLCAETNSLSKQLIGENDFIYFISGNSGPGRLCGETLAGLYGSSHLSRFVPIDGLEPRADLFEEKGMGNLIEALSFLIERHAGNTIILATGGFKAQIALATELGILFRQKVYYLYENFKAAVQLPELPVDFDYTAIADHQDAFFQLLDAREYWLAESTYATLPSTLKLCFQKDGLQRRYTLTALGRAIVRGFKGKQIDDIPISVVDNSMLWGSQRKSYRQMINPDIIVILDRISNNRQLITGLEFYTSMTSEIEHRKENCLELVKHQDARLVYVIHRLKDVTNRTEILTIKTLPGMASTLLGRIGKRIYP